MAFTTDQILGEFEDAARMGGRRQVEAAAFWENLRARWMRTVVLCREVMQDHRPARRRRDKPL